MGAVVLALVAGVVVGTAVVPAVATAVRTAAVALSLSAQGTPPAGVPAAAPAAPRTPATGPPAGTRPAPAPAVSSAATPRPVGPAAGTAIPGWVPTFQDDFDGTSLDPSKWNRPTFWSEGGRALYLPDNVRLQDGRLRLESRRQQYPFEGRNFEYTSGFVDTRERFSQLYGRFEVRARLPKGKGVWPAHWLMPQGGGAPAELDIMELLGGDPSTVYMTNHWGTAASPEYVTRSHTGPDFSTDFHTFALEWEPGRLRWLVDGVLRATTTDGVPAVPMYLILNTGIGGTWPGYPDDSTVLPQAHDIEYVRVYRRATGDDYLPLVPSVR